MKFAASMSPSQHIQRPPLEGMALTNDGYLVGIASEVVVDGQSVEWSFDAISHELLLRAVRKHTDCAWVLLYIERWLKAPVQLEDGTLEPREKGSPQGSVVSPLLANLFLHWAFDRWMVKQHPETPFERFADDILCHCG